MHEKWDQVKEILALALEQDPVERSGFIRQACGEDTALRAEVESLASHYDGADSLLENSPAPHMLLFQPTAMSPRKIGAYRITRMIGQGGMAVVYLGERDDQEFRKSVAIKMVQPGTNAKELFQRFRNERQTLAALDHPNIVRLLDGGSTEEGLPYLVMDYVDGMPIDRYCDLRQASIDERLELFRTVCSAVQYAHDKLIIHRDLKPGNILITREGVPRLLDFGIAKLLDPELYQTALVTQTNWRPMTPEYASPEQVRGQSVTKSSDIYSLGVLLYELLTGHRPYRSVDSLLEIERAICDEEAEKPSTAVTRSANQTTRAGRSRITPELVSKNRGSAPGDLRRRLQGDLDTIVMKALRKEPEHRYRSASEFSDDIKRHLTGEPVAARQPTVSYRGARFVRRHKETATAVAIALTVIAGFAVWETHRMRQFGQEESRPSAAQVRMRPSLALLGFKNLSGRDDTTWISTALSETLAAQLAAGEELRTIPGETVARTKVDLGLTDAESIAPDTLEQVRKNLGSDFVVLGSYFDSGRENGGRIRLDLRLEDALKKETIATVSEMGSEKQLLSLVSQAGARLRERLGLSQISPLEAQGIQASVASNPDGMRFYSQGLAKLRTFDLLAARDLLTEAITADRSYPLAHSALASTWASLGYDANSRDEAKRALDLSDKLSREDHLLVEARYYEAGKSWQKATETYRALFNFFPDDLDYGLALARAQSSDGKGKDALNTLAALLPASTSAKDDPRIDLAVAEAAASLGDDRLRRDAAERAATKADRQGAKLLLARARTTECRALANLGDNDQANAACDQARRIFTDAGDREGLARAFHTSAEVPLNQGDLISAEKLYRQALSILQEIGAQSTGSELNNLGLIYVKRGDFATGHNLYAQALRSYQTAGDKNGIAVVTGNAGNLLRSEGRISEALVDFETTLKLSNELGHRASAARSLASIGDVLLEKGDLTGAYKMYQQAMAIQQEAGAKSNYAESLVQVGEVFRQQGDPDKAQQAYQQAMSLQEQLGEKGTLAETQLALAQLAYDSGKATEAENLTRAALRESQAQKHVLQEISAQCLLSRALLLQGKIGEAKESIARASELSEKTPDAMRRLSLSLDKARFLAATKRLLAAEIAARQVLTEAHKLGLVRQELEATLDLDEIQLERGKSQDSRNRLVNVSRDARAKGFLLIAQQATAAAHRF